ncbi:hypothetical protein SGLAM104S_00980 [Streptomyces glaucescens]
MRTAAALPPVETSSRSMPCAWRSRAKRTVSSGVQPPSSSQSVAETRKNSGLSSGHTSRTASTTSRANRVRFSYEPP